MGVTTKPPVIFGMTDIANLEKGIRHNLGSASIQMEYGSGLGAKDPSLSGSVYRASSNVKAAVAVLAKMIRHDAKELNRLAKSLETVFEVAS